MSSKIIVFQTKNNVELYGSIKELMLHETPKIDGNVLSKWQVYRYFNNMKEINKPLKFDIGKIFERHIKRSKHEK